MDPILEAKKTKYTAMTEKELLAEAERLSTHEDKTVRGFGRTLKKCVLNKFIDLNEFFTAVNVVLFTGGPVLAICIGAIIGATLLLTTLVPFIILQGALKAQNDFLKTRLKWTDPNAVEYRELSKEIRNRHIRVTTEGFEIVNEKVVTGKDLDTINIDGVDIGTGYIGAGQGHMSIPGNSYDDLLAHQAGVYDDGEMLKIINSDDVVKLYNDYAEMNIDRIIKLTEMANAGVIDANSCYTMADMMIADEIDAILKEGVMTKDDLRTYMVQRYFDTTDDPVVLRRTLKLRYNWNRRVTELIKSMLINNYQLLGYTKDEAMKMVEDISNGKKRESIEAVYDKIIADNHIMGSSTCDLRKYGFGVIYSSDELIRDFSEDVNMFTDAMIQSTRYDAVIVAHGMTNRARGYKNPDGTQSSINQISNQYDGFADLSEVPDDIRAPYERCMFELGELGVSLDELRSRYPLIREMYKMQVERGVKFYYIDILKGNHLVPADIAEDAMYEIRGIENKYKNRYKSLFYDDFLEECQAIYYYMKPVMNLDKWKIDHTWVAQQTRIGNNKPTSNVAQMITNVLNTQTPKPKTIMVMNCNPDNVKLPKSFMNRKDVVIHVANYSNLATGITKNDFVKKIKSNPGSEKMQIIESIELSLESVDYTYEMDEMDSALYETEQYLMEFSKKAGIDYNDNAILMESVYDVISEADIVVEGVISAVWKAVINFIKSVLKALIALFKAVINFFKRIFNLIRNIFRALVGKPPVPYDISYIAMEGAEIDTFRPRTNKDIEAKLKKSCEKMGKELQQLSKLQTRITEEIKKDAERKAKEDAEAMNESVGVPYFDGYHWSIVTEAPKEEIIPEDTNDYTDDADDDDEENAVNEEDPEEEPEETPEEEEPTTDDDGGDEPAEDTEPATTDYTEDEDLTTEEPTDDTTEEEPLDPNAEGDEDNTEDTTDDTGDDMTEEDPEATDDMGDDTTDYTEDGDLGEGEGTTDDATTDDTTTDDMGGEDEEQSQNNIVKNYNLMIDFKKLFTTTSDILTRLGDVVFKKPIQNQVLDRCIQNLQTLKEQILNYMEFTFSTKYEDNLYYYHVFVQALKLNLEIMKKNSQLGDSEENS